MFFIFLGVKILIVIILNKTIVHFEIPADDVEKLKSFYEELLGWKFIHTSMPGMEYWMIHTVPTDENGMIQAPGINGGMYKKENPMQKPLNYISVKDVDSHLKKLVSLGGTVVAETMKIEGVGLIAIGLDPEGNFVALLQPEM